MSKSYSKYKMIGICYGNNTPFYRERRVHQRRVNKNRLRNAMAKYNNDEIDDEFIPYVIPKEDQWDEPTDGHYKGYPNELRKRIGNYYNGIYLTKDGRYVKK